MDTELKRELDRMNKCLGIYTENQNKHLKGYMFDSLVYRYKLARHHQTELEVVNEGKCDGHPHNYDHYIRAEERDVKRFIEILDEAIGERD